MECIPSFLIVSSSGIAIVANAIPAYIIMHLLLPKRINLMKTGIL